MRQCLFEKGCVVPKGSFIGGCGFFNLELNYCSTSKRIRVSLVDDVNDRKLYELLTTQLTAQAVWMARLQATPPHLRPASVFFEAQAKAVEDRSVRWLVRHLNESPELGERCSRLFARGR